LPNQYLLKLIKIYNSLKFIKSNFYNFKIDLKYNENIFKKLSIDSNEIKLQLKSLNYEYTDENLSWHYHLFAGLKKYFKDQKIKILEIGTFDGEFTSFLSEIYKNDQIFTLDLERNDSQFINTYSRNEKSRLKKFLNLRENNLEKKNINFIELNSIKIINHFHDIKFDLIWIDGDHLNPQVTIDIINSLNLLNANGILCVDDIIMDDNFKKNKYVSNEGFLTLQHLEKNNLIKNYYIIKRINKKNAYQKKFISIGFLKNKQL